MSAESTQSTNEFEFLPISRQKAEKISSSTRFFGKELVSPETVEKIREPLRKTATELGANIVAGPSNLVNFVSSLFLPKSFTKHIPTSETFKKNIEQWTGESLEPSNLWEEYAQNVAAGVGSMIGLGGPRTPLGFAAPVAGEAVKEGLKYGGAPEWMQTAGNLATQMLFGTRGAPNPREAARAFHKQAEASIPQGQTIKVGRLENTLQNVITELQRGGTNPETAPSLSKAQEILTRIQQGNGRLDPKDMYAFRTAINAIRGDPQTLSGGRRFLDYLNKLMNTELKNYGKTQNPKFLKLLNEGDQIVQGLSKASRAVNFIKAKVPTADQAKNPYTWLLFALKPATILTGIGATKAAEFATRLATSPALRKHYGNTIKYALSGDAKGAAKELSAFDKVASKEFPELEQGDFEYLPR